MGYGKTCPALLQMAGHGGTVSRRTASNKLTKTVLTITKALTKTTMCFYSQKVEGHDPKIFSVPPTFKFVPAPLTRPMEVVPEAKAKCQITIFNVFL